MSRPTSQSHSAGHRYARERLSSYMDGQLPDREQARVQAHLQACPECRQDLRTLKWTKELAQQVPVLPVPRSFIVRQADLEPRAVAHARPRFAGALAGLQTAAAVVAVLLVAVVAGDWLLAGTHPAHEQAESAVARREIDTQAVPEPLLVTPENPLDAPAAGQQASESNAQPELKMLLAPTETQVEPTPEPSPTWTAPPTQTAPDTATPAGFSAEGTSTERSPTPQPTETATAAPADTPAVEPTPPPDPTWTSAPTWTPEPQQVAIMPVTETLVKIQVEEVESADPNSPPPQASRQDLGWRIAQAGLSAVLVGLVIAIVLLRLRRRRG
jgi:hypothetical protein